MRAYYIAPSILHDGQDGAEAKRERLDGRTCRVSISQRHAVSLSAKDRQMLLIGRVLSVCGCGVNVKSSHQSAHANPPQVNTSVFMSYSSFLPPFQMDF